MLVARGMVRPLQRGLASGFTPPSSARSIHLRVPPFQAKLPPSFITRVHLLVTRALSSLSAVARPHAELVARSASRQLPRQSIAQSLSFPARVALSRPALGGTPFMPRPVAVQRSMQQVGLGTARTFATSRPIFANLVENVPVACRALVEADFDVKSGRQEHFRLKKNFTKKSGAKTAKAPKRVPRVVVEEEKEALDVEALAQYFKTVPEAAVVTYLDIPLAPTPSGRIPLAEHPLPGPALAPLRAIHASHSKHAIKVSSLFRRLDAGKVWENGAAMEAFGDRSGLCTVLRIKFSGWTKAMVKSVIGEGGKGWCALVETSSWVHDVEEDSDADSILSEDPWRPHPDDAARATQSLVMPTLDFSETFTARAASETSSRRSSFSSEDWRPTPLSRSDSEHYSASDEFEEVDALSEPESLASVWGTESVHSASVASFSSEHWRRVSTVISDF
ncbi:hypothetical protein EXIGLDRAFT_259030 [Exidia glandulosa HHB12029]|uniref:Uncharacterized protein n=1 Tax=Exidia glandulosa HHB12029 TaxID=1314781 RepID=A0A165MDS1_EXIGL|nr:hypothetical protein EXIGLDRAFT_259030 [Exidia glandulosa HHB12029]